MARREGKAKKGRRKRPPTRSADRMTFGVFGPEKRDRYLALLRAGHGKRSAARSIRVSHETIRLFRKSEPTFETLESDAVAELVETVETALYRAAVGGNVTACQVILYNRCPEKWRDCRKVTEPGPPPPVPDSEFQAWQARMEKERLQFLRDTYGRAGLDGGTSPNGEASHTEPPPPSDGRTGDEPDPPATGDRP
jgi:hypothetical protein